MAKRKWAIGQTTIYKTLHGKLMIEQHPEALCFFSLPIFRLWAYLMKVIQKRVVRIKFDIYIFITNGVAMNYINLLHHYIKRK
jgi:hypothetical protein